MNTLTPLPQPVQPLDAGMLRHDKIYTASLGAIGFLSLLGCITLWAVTHSPTFPQNSVWAIHMAIGVNACLLLFESVVLIVRIAFPASRKWPTIALNIVLLLSFPLGTTLGVYGLWKVDKSIAA